MAEAMMHVWWQDAGGNMAPHTIHTNTGASGILAQLAALSAAVPRESFEGQPVRSGATPAATTYALVQYVAWLRFTDAGGSVARLALPAPPTTILQADGKSVDPATIAPLIAACIGTLLTAAGNPVTAFDGGVLSGQNGG